MWWFPEGRLYMWMIYPWESKYRLDTWHTYEFYPTSSSQVSMRLQTEGYGLQSYAL